MAGLVHQREHDAPAPPKAWLLLLSSLLIFLAHYGLAGRRRSARDHQRGRRPPPPSPPALPVVGHLHLLGAVPHVSLRRLAARHGPDLMLLRLGALPALVVSSPRAAEAVLRAHDHVFASRPRSAVADIVLYGARDVGLAPYGVDWRLGRKIIGAHLLSAKKVQSFSLARQEEVSMVMARVREAASAGAPVDMTELLTSFTGDLVCRAVSGRHFRSGGLNKLIPALVQDTTELLGGVSLEQCFPVLARAAAVLRMAAPTSARAKAERLRRRWDQVLDKMIDHHEGLGASPSLMDDDDFIHVLLTVKQEYGLTREHMKALLVDVFFGAADTSAQTLEFAIAELMSCPRAMKKLQDELRSSIPAQGQRAITEADMNAGAMAYLRAAVKEALRLHPLAPLLPPHCSMADCEIDGHAIPAGTRVLVNTWAMGRDARFWEDAEAFMPERFLAGGAAAGLNFSGNDFHYLPFGSGRRMCPGVNFGVAVVEIMLANLMHRFDWVLPPGVETVDMSMVLGIVARRKEKLLLVPTMRV